MTGDLMRDRVMASQRSAAAIADVLRGAGTRMLFGVPGGGPNLDMVGAAAASGLPFVLAHGESAATIMAATCADLTDAPGAVVVTRGPGLASAVNGIAHAALDRLPVVVIADTVPGRQRDRISHQRLDQPALGRSVAKAAVTAGAGNAEHAARRAVALAVAPPPGPVVINVDTDDVLPVGHEPPPHDGERPLLSRDDLAPLTAALRAAQRPAVLLGPGALRHTGAVRAALVGSGLPVLHSYRARGIVPDRAAEAELVAPLPAATGALTACRGRHHWPEAAGAAAKTAMASRLRQVASSAPGRLTPQDVVTAVRDHTPPETIATVDAGAHMLVAMPLWPVDEPHRLRVVLVVFNDAALSLIKIKQRPAGQGGTEAVSYGPVSFAAIATGMGAAAASVTDAAGLAAALAQALNRDGPTLIDTRVDPAGYPAVLDLTRGAAGRRGAPE